MPLRLPLPQAAKHRRHPSPKTNDALRGSAVEKAKKRRQFGDGVEQGVRLERADAFRGGEWSVDADGANAGAARHLNVFRRITHVEAFVRERADSAQGDLEGSGIRLAPGSILTADADGKRFGELKFLELPANTIAATAGDDSQSKLGAESLDNVVRAGKKLGALVLIGFVPQAVRFLPFFTGDAGGFIDAKPIRGVVAIEIFDGPGNAEGAKHGGVGARIGGIGIQEGAVPVKEDSAGVESRSGHRLKIVPEKRSSVAVITRRKLVVASNSNVVEAGGVAPPSGNIDFFGANDVSCGKQLHATHAEWPVDESDFELDGGAGSDFARREKVDSAGTDVAGDERHRIGLDGITDAREAERQA